MGYTTDEVFNELGQFLKELKELNRNYQERLEVWYSVEDRIYINPEKSYRKLQLFREIYTKQNS